MNIILPKLPTQRRGLKLVTGPASAVVDRDTEVKEFLRLDGTAEDTTLDIYIAAATDFVERYTGLKLINQTWDLWLDRFEYNRRGGEWWDGVRNGPVDILNMGSDYIDLPFGPCSSVTSLTTYDDDNASAVYNAANYTLDVANTPARLYLNEGETWPTDLRSRNAVQVTAVYGYGASSSDVPTQLRQAVLVLVGWLYENRGDCDSKEIPTVAQMIMNSYKVYSI